MISHMTIIYQDSQIFQISPYFRLQWEEAQNKHLLLYPEGMVALNQTAGEILYYCSLEKPYGEILRLLEEEYGHPSLRTDVEEFLQGAENHGWIRRKDS